MTQQAFIFNPGNYYVRYPCGGRSKNMPYRIARDYASIFGGNVFRDPAAPLARQSGLETAEGIFVGAILTALLTLAIGCAIFGARVMLGGG